MGEITLDSVTKEYDGGRVLAVDDISIGIGDGEFLVLLGPSGCGKSTTLRMIAGLEEITEGEIHIGERLVNGLEPRERNIAMVFQNYALYPHMSVRENMGFGLQLSTDLPQSEIDDRVEQAAEMMDIADLMEDKPKELSGGQQQRVALGRAIVREPEVFLFDEPLSNLDAKLRAHMRTELTRIQQELGVTSVYVTHDQAEAMTMGDRVAILDGGELQQVGTPNEVYDRPANRFVAEFIGEPSMNFLDVELDREGRLVHAGGDALSYSLDDRTVERLPIEPGQSLTLGVRPQDVSVEIDPADLGANAQTATVDVVEHMGSDNFLYLRLDGDVWTARTGRIEPDPGSQIGFGFDDAAVHLFDESGTTLKSRGTGDEAFHEYESVAESAHRPR